MAMEYVQLQNNNQPWTSNLYVKIDPRKLRLGTLMNVMCITVASVVWIPRKNWRSKELPGTIKKVSEFLGKSLTEEQEEALKDYLHINKFKKNSAVNFQSLKDVGILRLEYFGEQGFIRKGKTGGWVEEFTPELNKRADEWIRENLQRTDLRFPGMC